MHGIVAGGIHILPQICFTPLCVGLEVGDEIKERS